MKKLLSALLLAVAALTLHGNSLELLKNVKADSWNTVGGNYVLSGNVRIEYDDYQIFCDKAVINPKLGDLEVTGNCRLIKWHTVSRELTVKELSELEKHSLLKVEVKSISGNIFGERKLSTSIRVIGENVESQKIVGNIKSGYFRFDRLRLRTPTVVCRAASGERLPNGKLILNSGELSSCPYLESDNGHYSIGASKITLTPHKSGFYGAEHIERNFYDHTIVMVNGVVRVYGMPVFYLPVFYKPKDEHPGLFGIRFGKSSDWGFYFNLFKTFEFSEYPQSSVRLNVDWYLNRGVGYGANAKLVTENSRTDIFAYSIYDIRPYESEDYDNFRLKVPHYRFDLKVDHLTHITPRLDFRGSFEYTSDSYFVRDFFNSRFSSNPEPASFLSLEQQFDFMTAALYFRPRIVDSFTTVEKMPELLFQGQRQQIFNTPFYYQGDLTAGYYRMRWIDFDEKLKGFQGSRLSGYDAFRLDTTHFLYLPLKTDYFVLMPRAGFKLTTYSSTSKEKVSEDDLQKMFQAASPTNISPTVFNSYDSRGGARVRWIGELGAEFSTKIHNTWANLRSPFFRVDGLRHIMRPYVNYTFIGSPSLSREHIYYFDEIDRIDRQSFFRIGLENRLQTRDGNKLKELLRLENFMDIHTFSRDGMGNLGEFCTMLSTSPIEGLTISTQLMIDLGNNNSERPDYDKSGYPYGQSMIGVRWINRWNVSISYSPVQDVVFNLSYDYIRPYNGRYPYSMGSTLTMLETSRWFSKNMYEYSETVSFGVKLPITPDRRTFAGFSVGYDFVQGHVSSYNFMLRRLFHCFEVTAMLAFDHETERTESRTWDTSFSVNVNLTGLNSPVLQAANPVLSEAAAGTSQFNF